eukprot:SAG22_NODE_623_length_8459_cov_39.989474_3_plen_190_part_00
MVQLCDFKTVQEYAQYWCAHGLYSKKLDRGEPAPPVRDGTASRAGCCVLRLGSGRTVRYGRRRNMVPPPGQVFSAQPKTVEGLCIFKKGIKPMWEDPANAAGGEWQCRQPFDPLELDMLWENLVRWSPFVASCACTAGGSEAGVRPVGLCGEGDGAGGRAAGQRGRDYRRARCRQVAQSEHDLSVGAVV